MNAISYMMSVLLMLLVVTVGAVSAMLVAQGWLTEALEGYSIGMRRAFSGVYEDFVVEEVRLDYQSGPGGIESIITVYIRNSGSVDITIASIYFDGRDVEVIEGSKGSTRLYLLPNEGGWLRFKLGYEVQKGVIHEIVVWSSGGKKVSEAWVFE